VDSLFSAIRKGRKGKKGFFCVWPGQERGKGKKGINVIRVNFRVHRARGKKESSERSEPLPEPLCKEKEGKGLEKTLFAKAETREKRQKELDTRWRQGKEKSGSSGHFPIRLLVRRKGKGDGKGREGVPRASSAVRKEKRGLGEKNCEGKRRGKKRRALCLLLYWLIGGGKKKGEEMLIPKKGGRKGEENETENLIVVTGEG